MDVNRARKTGATYSTHFEKFRSKSCVRGGFWLEYCCYFIGDGVVLLVVADLKRLAAKEAKTL